MSETIAKYIIITFSIENNPYPCHPHVFNWKLLFKVYDYVLFGSYPEIPCWKRYSQKNIGEITRGKTDFARYFRNDSSNTIHLGLWISKSGNPTTPVILHSKPWSTHMVKSNLSVTDWYRRWALENTKNINKCSGISFFLYLLKFHVLQTPLLNIGKFKSHLLQA